MYAVKHLFIASGSGACKNCDTHTQPISNTATGSQPPAGMIEYRVQRTVQTKHTCSYELNTVNPHHPTLICS
jgi:hypothetical protein